MNLFHQGDESCAGRCNHSEWRFIKATYKFDMSYMTITKLFVQVMTAISHASATRLAWVTETAAVTTGTSALAAEGSRTKIWRISQRNCLLWTAQMCWAKFPSTLSQTHLHVARTRHLTSERFMSAKTEWFRLIWITFKEKNLCEHCCDVLVV